MPLKKRIRTVGHPWKGQHDLLTFEWEPTENSWFRIDPSVTPMWNLPPFEFTDQWFEDYVKGSYEDMHNCSHVKRRVVCNTSELGFVEDRVHVLTSTTEFGKSMSIPMNALYRDTDRNAIPFYDYKFVESLFASHKLPGKVDLGDKFDPSDGFSIWMLLADLREFPKLLKSVWRFVRLLKNYRQLSIREMANTNLLVQFGLLATLEDVTKFFHICKTWRDAYDTLRSSQDLRHRWRSVEEIPEDILPAAQTYIAPIFGHSGLSTAFVSETRKVLHSRVLKYRITCPELTGWLARVAQFVDAFGFLQLAAVWDRIPWSFVVDWFYPFGNWLERHTPKVFPLDIVIVDYCEAIKYSRRLAFSTSHYAGYPPEGPASGSLTTTPYAYVFEKIYVRRRYKPPTHVIKKPKLKMPTVSFRRISIAASLIAQRLPRSVLR